MMDSRMGKIIGDRESIWKFYRTDVWMIFIGDRSLPVPFNIVSCLLDKILMMAGKNSAGTYQKETVKYELFFKIDSCIEVYSRFYSLIGRLVERYKRHVEDSSASSANREHLKNLKKDLRDTIEKYRNKTGKK